MQVAAKEAGRAMSGWSDSNIVIVFVVDDVVATQVCKELLEKLGVRCLVGLTATSLLFLLLMMLLLMMLLFQLRCAKCCGRSLACVVWLV